MADRGRVGLDLAPNKAIREQHISTVQAIHTSRLARISRGKGVVTSHLEDKFRRTRTGAKTMAIKKERVDHIALENRLLVERMKRIVTHSKPVWEDGPANSSIHVDHQSVLRPVMTAKRKKQEKMEKRLKLQQEQQQQLAQNDELAVVVGDDPNSAGDDPNSAGANPDTLALSYSDDYADDFNDHDMLNPLNASHNNLEMSRGSINNLEQSAVSVRFGDTNVVNLDGSYATHTGVPACRPSTAAMARPKSATSTGRRKSLLPHQRPPSAGARRPSTAGARATGGARPKSAATAPGGLTGEYATEEEFEMSKKVLLKAEMRRKSSVVTSISGLSRLRHFERIARDNQKIVHHMSNIGAYYSNSDWEEDRAKQKDRMARFRKFTVKKGSGEKIKKAGLRNMYQFAEDNKAKIDEWEAKMEGRKDHIELQRAVTKADFQKSASMKEAQMKEKLRMKKEFMETKKKEREEEEEKKREEEKDAHGVARAVRKTSAARKGLAFAASKFNRVLVRNEEKRAAVQREMVMLASAATSQILAHISVNKNQDHLSDAEGIQKVRKTLVQHNQDQALNSMLEQNKRQSKVDKEGRELHHHHSEKNSSDYLASALTLLGGHSSGLDLTEGGEGEEKHIDMVPAKPITSQEARGGVTSWAQESLITAEKIRVRLIKEGDVDPKSQKELDCRVWCDVVSEENMEIRLEECEEEAGGVGVGKITFLQRVPRLIIVERERALKYARALLSRLAFKKNLLVFEQIMMGSIVRHDKRGEGVVTAIDPTTKCRHVTFGDKGDVHRYLETSWHKLKLIRAEGVPHDGLWAMDWNVLLDLESNKII